MSSRSNRLQGNINRIIRNCICHLRYRFHLFKVDITPAFSASDPCGITRSHCRPHSTRLCRVEAQAPINLDHAIVPGRGYMQVVAAIQSLARRGNDIRRNDVFSQHLDAEFRPALSCLKQNVGIESKALLIYGPRVTYACMDSRTWCGNIISTKFE